MTYLTFEINYLFLLLIVSYCFILYFTATKAVIESEDIINDSKKKTYTKSTIKVKKMDDIKDTLKRKPIIISPNLKKVKIIKKI